MLLDARANEETLLMFIERKGHANTGEIARRYGWLVTEANIMLINLARDHRVERYSTANNLWADQWMVAP